MEEEIQSEDCTDGQPQMIAGHQEDGQNPDCTDQGVMWSEEREVIGGIKKLRT